MGPVARAACETFFPFRLRPGAHGNTAFGSKALQFLRIPNVGVFLAMADRILRRSSGNGMSRYRPPYPWPSSIGGERSFITANLSTGPRMEFSRPPCRPAMRILRCSPESFSIPNFSHHSGVQRWGSAAGGARYGWPRQLVETKILRVAGLSLRPCAVE
jgi:hypothetical protein